MGWQSLVLEQMTSGLMAFRYLPDTKPVPAGGRGV